MAGALGVDPSSHKHLPDLDPSQRNKTYCDAYFTCDRASWRCHSMDRHAASYNVVQLLVRALPSKEEQANDKLFKVWWHGDQRKPIGFSGDSLRKWDTLAYEVYMTPRAANVGFGWWSHDIGGFSGGYLNNTNHRNCRALPSLAAVRFLLSHLQNPLQIL